MFRRKLFILLLIVLCVILFAQRMDLDLSGGVRGGAYGEAADFEGKVLEIREKGTEYFVLRVKVDKVDGAVQRDGETVQLSYFEAVPKPWELLHRRIAFRTSLQLPDGARNPHCFDYRLYLMSKGIFHVGEISDFVRLEENRRGFLSFGVGLIDGIERFLTEQRWKFQRELSDESKGIIMGLLFGDTTFIDEEEYDAFRNNGTAHVLAVSGLHVGILYGIYRRIVGKRNRLPGILCFELFLWMYGTLSSWSPSTTRAIIMVTMSLLANYFDLRYDLLTAMSFAALAVIAKNPYVIFGASFQMSFLAIASIAFINPILSGKLPELFRTSVAVNLGLMMYQIAQFNSISPVTVIVNIPVIFLVGYVVPAALLVFVLWVFAGGAVLAVASPLLDGGAFLLRAINDFASMGGSSSIDVKSPPAWLSMTVFLTLFFLCSENFYILKERKLYRQIAAYMVSFFMIAAISGIFSSTPLDDAKLVFVDVGQGDAIHIRAEGKNVLIDGGGRQGYDLGKKVLKPYLLKNGAGHLDLALATHTHTDHYKGQCELAACYRIDLRRTGLSMGSRINISDDVFVDVLWPEAEDAEEGQEENRYCSVLMVNYGEIRILLTGDLDEEGERLMMAGYAGREHLLKADILKIGHHGSKTSTGEDFLDVVNPQAVIIQVGKNNYGHPAPITIEKCRKRGIIVYRNDKDGAIGVEPAEGGFRVTTMLSGSRGS